ncbi:hypothetical protein ACFPDQ_03380 [Pseudofrancisella aestuarii]|uniref:DUF945 family protein n=1 Tax=Pseudofrancisella aestuarii TaxID=2670347 RepID=A0ABV9TBC4_9GAMM|nr:hypothetical protein [Pseudofrancisella aestuarii]
MNFKRKVLALLMASSVLTFTAYADDIKENDIQKQAVEKNIAAGDVKDLIAGDISSLLSYQNQVTVGNVKVDDSGNISASNLLIISKDKQKLNMSINQLEIQGLDANGTVDGDFKADIEGLSITNLPTAVAESGIVPADDKDEAIAGAANNDDLNGTLLNILGEGIYNISIKYDYDKKHLSLDINSTNNKHKFISAKIDFDNVDLYGAKVKDLGNELPKAISESNLGNFKITADFSDVIKRSTEQLLGKYKNYPTFVFNASFDKDSRDLKIYANGKLAGKDFLKYDFLAKDVNLPDISVKEIPDDYVDVLKVAYIDKSSSLVDVNFEFSRKDFPKDSKVQSVFDFVKKDNIQFELHSDQEYSSSKFNSNASFSGQGLASLSGNSVGVVDGNLELLPYLGLIPETEKNSLYNCKNRLCIKSFKIKFENKGLLQEVAKLLNPDPNTPASQALASYGALAQLLAVQQKDQFVRKVLSSVAIFLQNPQSISVEATAKKPVNQNVAIKMMLEDANKLQEANNISDKGVQVNEKQPSLKFFGNVDKIFDINFLVNGSKTNV